MPYKPLKPCAYPGCPKLTSKRYCEEHDIQVGDEIAIANNVYTVTGIGTTADYDAPFKKFSDTAIDSKLFVKLFFLFIESTVILNFLAIEYRLSPFCTV